MAEMTIEQKRAVALAQARLRMKAQMDAAAAQAPAAVPRPDAPQFGGDPFAYQGAMVTRGMDQAGDALIGMGLEAGGAAGGQALGAMTGPAAPFAVPAFGLIGSMGGNAISQFQRGGKFRLGEFLGAGAAGLVPGGSEVKGAIGLGKEAAKQAAGNIAATAIETGVDQGRAPTGGEAALAGVGGVAGTGASRLLRGKIPSPLTPFENLAAKRIEAYRAVRPYGAKVAPFELERGTNLAAKVAGGKTAIQKDISSDNQYVWQKMAREQMGLPVAERPITTGRLLDDGRRFVGDFDKALVKAYEPYEKIAKSVPGARADMDSLRLARKAEQLQWKAFQDGKATYPDYQKAKADADALDSKVEAQATAAGLKPEAIQDARKKIAIIYAYQNATDKSTGYVDANALGHMLNNDVPLTGNAAKIADFANSFSKNAVEATKAQAAGINNLTMQLSGGMMAQEGKTGKIIGLLNLFAGDAVRKRIMSEQYQNALASVRMQSGPEDFTSSFARFGAQSASRPNQSQDPYGFNAALQGGINRGSQGGR